MVALQSEVAAGRSIPATHCSRRCCRRARCAVALRPASRLEHPAMHEAYGPDWLPGARLPLLGICWHRRSCEAVSTPKTAIAVTPRGPETRSLRAVGNLLSRDCLADGRRSVPAGALVGHLACRPQCWFVPCADGDARSVRLDSAAMVLPWRGSGFWPTLREVAFVVVSRRAGLGGGAGRGWRAHTFRV